jgi:hypothetical protein
MKTIYRNYIITNNDYPHPELKLMFYHEDDTDGICGHGKDLCDCKIQIDCIID